MKKARRRAKIGLVVASASFVAETLVVPSIWAFEEWQPWIAASLGVTLLFAVLFVVILVTRPPSQAETSGSGKHSNKP